MEKLIETANKSQEKIYLLIEGGAFEDGTFEPFQRKNARSLYSLYQHPQSREAKWVGPWLYQVKNNIELAAEMTQFPHVVTVIFSSLNLKPLAMQLAWGCTLVTPTQKTVVSRFYHRDVMTVLVHCQQFDWHYYLFSGTSQWWHLTLSGWQPTGVATKTYPNTHDRTVYLDESTWQQIDDDREVTSILAQWQQMPMSQHFPPCIQRQKVIQALQKASEAGMRNGEDKKLYALLYLDGQKLILTSDFVTSKLELVSQGKFSLQRVLCDYEKVRSGRWL